MAKDTKKGLGRGLSELFGDDILDNESEGELIYAPIAKVEPRAEQPRSHFDDDALQELPEQDEQIDALLRRRLRSDTPDRDELRRASDYLYRRGFGRDEIRAAIARYQDNFEEY